MQSTNTTTNNLDYDQGELLVFQESTNVLLFPPRSSHRFGRFPPPPIRWPRGAASSSPLSTARSGRHGNSPTSWGDHNQQHHHHSHHQPQPGSQRTLLDDGGSAPNTPATVGHSARSAANMNALQSDDIHWTLVSEGAFVAEINPSALGSGGSGVIAAASSGGAFKPPAPFSPSVLVTMTSSEHQQLAAQQQQQQLLREQMAGTGFALATATSSSSSDPLLTVGDKTLLVLSVGCPAHRVDVALAIWYSNSEKGIKPGAHFSQTPYLIEFLKHAAHELGFLPLSPLSSLVTSSHNSHAATAAVAASIMHDLERPTEMFLAVRAALRERLRQLRVVKTATSSFPVTLPRAVMKTAREMHLNVQDEALKHSWDAAKALHYLSNPADQAVLNFGCSAVAYAIALTRNSPLYGACSSAVSGGSLFPPLPFGFSAVAAAAAASADAAAMQQQQLDLRTPPEQHINNNHRQQPQHQQQQHQQYPPLDGSRSGPGSPTSPKQLQTLTELLATAVQQDLDACGCSAQQKSLVKVEQMIEAIQFFHQHPGNARIVILSRKDGNNEDHTATCIFNVLRAVFRPAGRFAHSRDSGLFARKISDREAAKPGMVWGPASFWTPLTHIEFGGDSALVSSQRNIPTSALAGAASSSLLSSSAAGMMMSVVADDAFFVPRLQSALEFDHTLLVIDCMQKHIFLAAPSSAAIAAAAAAASSTSLGAAAGGGSHSVITPTGSNSNPMFQQQQQQGQNQSSGAAAGAKNYVLSALPSAVTFVEECKTLWQAQQSAVAQQSSAGGSAQLVVACDVLRAIVELSPVLRSMAEAEFAQLLLRQCTTEGEHRAPITPPRGDNNQFMGTSPTTTTHQNHQHHHQRAVSSSNIPSSLQGGAPVASSSLHSPMRLRSNLSSLSPSRPRSATLVDNNRPTSAFPSAPNSGYNTNSAAPATTTSGLKAALKSSVTAAPQLLSAFQSNDPMFALLV